jgi:hypothetical protein
MTNRENAEALPEGRQVVPSGSRRTLRATTGASRCRALFGLSLSSCRRELSKSNVLRQAQLSRRRVDREMQQPMG